LGVLFSDRDDTTVSRRSAALDQGVAEFFRQT
jgi:hypothetical protein